MGHMGHADCIGTALTVAAYIFVNLHEVIPVNGALKGIEHKAVVAHVLTKIWIIETSFLPSLCYKAGCIHCAVVMADFPNLTEYVFAESFFTFGKSEKENSLSVLITPEFKEGINGRIGNTVKTEAH